MVGGAADAKYSQDESGGVRRSSHRSDDKKQADTHVQTEISLF